ncbi:MAG: BamA/TamA family outer membrane protein [Bryobacteraceae bacterium]
MERRLLYIKEAKIIERFSAGVGGFRAKLGGMVTGGGFGIGPEYLREDLARGEMVFRAAAQRSLRGYSKYDLEVGAPSVARNRLKLQFLAVHHNYPSINYYGPGPDSEKTGKSNYRLEETAADGLVAVKPLPHFWIGGSGGHLWLNVGPGTDERFISAERQFSPSQAPGIDQQTNFLRYGGFAQLDYRDNSFGARSGGNYTVRFDRYTDRNLSRHDFDRVEAELQQFIPFFNKRRVIALRGKTSLTYLDPGQTVPFYLQAVLGGSDDLRGFRTFRFHDTNSLLLNAEYRWETFSGLDMAIFADAGKVFPRRSQLNFTNLESAVGVGMRFNARNSVFLRIDVGFSHEGFQVWFKFGNIFAQRPFGSSVPAHVQ